MKIYRPMRTDRITQEWGANKPCVRKDTRPFEFLPCNHPESEKLYPALGLRGHPGRDNAAEYREPIRFPVQALGIDWEADSHTDSNGAITVVVRSKQPVPFTEIPEHVHGSLSQIAKQWNELNGKLYLQFWFVHLDSTPIKEKQDVKFGHLIGYAGDTGVASGVHLHWSMKVSDPNSWYFIDGDNGYEGAVDFSPYYINEYVVDVIKKQKTGRLPLSAKVRDAADRLTGEKRRLLIRFASLLESIGE